MLTLYFENYEYNARQLHSSTMYKDTFFNDRLKHFINFVVKENIHIRYDIKESKNQIYLRFNAEKNNFDCTIFYDYFLENYEKIIRKIIINNFADLNRLRFYKLMQIKKL